MVVQASVLDYSIWRYMSDRQKYVTMEQAPLIFSPAINGIYKVILDIDFLFQDSKSRETFDKKWLDFSLSCFPLDKIFIKQENILEYSSESFIPSKIDWRPPLLFLFGNPACHSVVEGFCFLYEAQRKEHRLWKALKKTGLMEFNTQIDDPYDCIDIKKKNFFDLNYVSPFRIAISTFFSFPSPASDKNWSGISGIKRLFGAKAIRMISNSEKERIDKEIKNFVRKSGGIICFQKDAYEMLRSPDSPSYSPNQAMDGNLIGSYARSPQIKLFCAPPTRYANTSDFCRSLIKYTKIIQGE